MLTNLILLWYFIPLQLTFAPAAYGTTITSPRRPQMIVGGGGRLSLINYRFNRRPRKKNLDSRELKMALGSSYDSKYMSIEPPSEMSKEKAAAIYVVKQDSEKYNELLINLQTSNVTEDLNSFSGSKFETDDIKSIEKWLLRKASCPVRFAWEDIGAMFWPRYIRRGECGTESTSCSWPPGMHCVPSGSTTIQILRWQCRTTKRKERRRGYKAPGKPWNKDEEKPVNVKCSWVRVPYPITSECMCTC